MNGCSVAHEGLGNNYQDLLSFSRRFFMNSKPFKTFEEQINILENRNLKFLNKPSAIPILATYGYYEIVNGYKEVVLNEDGENFKGGITFEHLFSLFQMDRKIRTAVSEAMHELESHLQTTISYVVSNHYSSEQSEYLQRNHYATGKNYNGKYERDKLLDKCKRICRDDIQPYQHYRKKYGNVPPWILIKGMEFGDLLLFYRLQKSNVKIEIISMMTSIPKELITNGLIEVMTVMFYFCKSYRNRSAHDRRIYNYHLTKHEMPYYEPFHNRMGVSKELYDNDGKGKSGLNVLFYILSWFKTFGDPWQILNYKVIAAVDEHLNNYPEDQEFIYNELEFEED